VEQLMLPPRTCAIGVVGMIMMAEAAMVQDRIKATIERLNREYSQVYNAGQLEKVLDFFAEDAVTLSPGQAPVRGPDAVGGSVPATII